MLFIKKINKANTIRTFNRCCVEIYIKQSISQSPLNMTVSSSLCFCTATFSLYKTLPLPLIYTKNEKK